MVTLTTVYTTDGEVVTSASTSQSITAITIQKNTSTGLSSHEKVIVGCTVGLIAPAIILSIGGVLFYYRKKNANVDHSGQEWNDDDGDGENINVYDDFEGTRKSTGLGRGQSVNRAINF